MTTDRRQSAAIWVDAIPVEQRVRPGEQAVFAIGVENRGASAQTQAVTIEGLPSAWVHIEYDSRSIAFPRERRSGTVRVSVPVDAEGGRHEFEIVARAGSEEASAKVVIDVQAVEMRPLAPGLSLTPSTIEMTAGQGEERLRLEVRNVGSRETEYRPSVEGLASNWYRLAPPIRIAGGATAITELWLAPPRTAEAGSHRFSVRFQATDFPDVSDDIAGELRVRPAPIEDGAGSNGPMVLPLPPPPPPPPPPPIGGGTAPPVVIEDESPVLPPDAQLAPSTQFRFGAGRVSEQAMLTVQNPSRIRERYEIAVLGLPDDWYTITADDVSLEAGATQQIPLRLSPHPGPEYPAGEYHFSVRIAPRGFPQAATELQAILMIEGVESFELRLEPPQAVGRTVRYQMTLRNTGTRPLQLEVDGSDPEGRVKFKVPPIPELEAGRELALPLVVGARRGGIIGSPETFDFRINARPVATTTGGRTFDARLVHRPMLSRRVPVIAGFLGALIAAVLLLVAWSPRHVEGFAHWGGCKVHNGPECVAALVTSTPSPTATTAPTSGPSTATPTTTGTAAVEGAVCTNDPNRRSEVPELAIGVTAFADDRSNIRNSPEVAQGNIVGQVRLADISNAADHERARTVTILRGPVCTGDFIWWEVHSDFYGLDGWVVEHDGTEINLSPTP